jgi:ER lumen protein retaining receptor
VELVRQYNSTIFVWAGFSTLVYLVYFFFSDGDFSFIMTYASLTRAFGFVLLNARMFIKGHVKGISLKTLQIYAAVFAARLISVVEHQGYLPYDRSGDYIYHLAEGGSLALCISCMFMMYTRYSRSYQVDYDNFGSYLMPSTLGSLWLIVPCCVFAVFLHPSLNEDFISDTFWTASMYLETCAIIPQLYMFQQSTSNKGIVEVIISHYVFALGFARICDMIFWVYSYHELTDAAGSTSTGILVLATQFIHIAIMADFFYCEFVARCAHSFRTVSALTLGPPYPNLPDYLIAIRTGGMMQLPMATSMV